MAVLLPNTSLALRRRIASGEDEHGDVYAVESFDAPVGPFPGRTSGPGAELQGQTDPTRIALDEALWPVAPRDLVVEYDATGKATGREWLLGSADLIQHSTDASVNYVRCIGHLRQGADTLP